MCYGMYIILLTNNCNIDLLCDMPIKIENTMQYENNAHVRVGAPKSIYAYEMNPIFLKHAMFSMAIMVLRGATLT
jgi:hypothetical protein